MTGAIVLLCAAFVIFVAPIALMSMFDPYVTHPILYLLAFMIYWFQYSLNFVIYSARSEQYRNALKDFLVEVKCRVFKRKPAPVRRRAFLVDKALLPRHVRSRWPRKIHLGNHANGLDRKGNLVHLSVAELSNHNHVIDLSGGTLSVVGPDSVVGCCEQHQVKTTSAVIGQSQFVIADARWRGRRVSSSSGQYLQSVIHGGSQVIFQDGGDELLTDPTVHTVYQADLIYTICQLVSRARSNSI